MKTLFENLAYRGLALAALMMVLLPLALWGQQRTVVCDDGRVVLLTPFNSSNPCANPVAIDPTKDIPDEFLLAFGPPPEPTGNSLADRIARVEYQQALKVFRGLIDAPAEYFQKPRLTPGATQTIAEYYASWGLGEPIFYKDIYGSYVRWPHAIYGAWRAPLSVATLAPGIVVAQWEVDAILDGKCMFDVMAIVPGWVSEQNRANCKPVLEAPAARAQN